LLNQGNGALTAAEVTPQLIAKLKTLDQIAQRRGQSLAQLALAWLLKDARVTSVLIGASRPEQISDCVGSLANLRFDAAELDAIDQVLQRD
jgi:L-glyceraldehyde 3-phosphate reductase